MSYLSDREVSKRLKTINTLYVRGIVDHEKAFDMRMNVLARQEHIGPVDVCDFMSNPVQNRYFVDEVKITQSVPRVMLV